MTNGILKIYLNTLLYNPIVYTTNGNGDQIVTFINQASSYSSITQVIKNTDTYGNYLGIKFSGQSLNTVNIKITFSSSSNPRYVLTNSLIAILFDGDSAISTYQTFPGPVFSVVSLSISNIFGNGYVGVENILNFSFLQNLNLINTDIIIISSIKVIGSNPTGSISCNGDSSSSLTIQVSSDSQTISFVLSKDINYNPLQTTTIIISKILSSNTSITNSIDISIKTSSGNDIAKSTSSWKSAYPNQFLVPTIELSDYKVGEAMYIKINAKVPFNFGSPLSIRATVNSGLASCTQDPNNNNLLFGQTISSSSSSCVNDYSPGSQSTYSLVEGILYTFTWNGFTNFLSTRPYSINLSVYQGTISNLMISSDFLISSLTMNTLTIKSFTLSSNSQGNKAYMDSLYLLTISSLTSVPQKAFIYVQIPNIFKIPASNMCPTTTCTTKDTYTLIYSFEGSDITASNDYVIRFYLTNPETAHSYSYSLTVTTYSQLNGETTAYSSTTGALTGNLNYVVNNVCSNSPLITPSSYIRTYSSTYLIDFTGCTPIPSNSQIVISFPISFTFSNSISCQSICGSSTGVSSCTFIKDISYYNVTVNFDFSSCTTKQISISGISNPFLPGPLSDFSIRIIKGSYETFNVNFSPLISILTINANYDSFITSPYLTLGSYINGATTIYQMNMQVCNTQDITLSSEVTSYINFNWTSQNFQCSCNPDSSKSNLILSLTNSQSTSCTYIINSGLQCGNLYFSFGSCTNPISTSLAISFSLNMYFLSNSKRYNAFSNDLSSKTLIPYSISSTFASSTINYPGYPNDRITFTLDNIYQNGNKNWYYVISTNMDLSKTGGSIQIFGNGGINLIDEMTIGVSASQVSSSKIIIPQIVNIMIIGWFNNYKTLSDLQSDSGSKIIINSYDDQDGILGSANLKPPITCNYPCATCPSISSPSTCNSCYNYGGITYYLWKSSCNLNCDVSSNYFAYLSNGNCVGCTSPCYTCIDEKTCKSCTSDYVLQDTTCQKNCNTNYYPQNNVCYLCDSNCATCVNSPITCTSCNTIQGYYLNTITSTCTNDCTSIAENYFKASSGKCEKCDSNCKKCLGNSANCTLCYPSSTLPYLYQNTCLSECPAGFFINGTFCDSCVSPCINCKAKNTCLKCDSNLGYILYNDKCVTSCPSSYSNIGGVCVLCDQGCLTCSGNSETCTQCIPSKYLYNAQCVETCPLGSYLSESTCKICPSGCQQCKIEGATLTCIACLNGFFLYGNTCTTTCPIGFQISSNKASCELLSTGGSILNAFSNGTLVPFPFLISTVAASFFGLAGQIRDSYSFISSNILFQASLILKIASFTQIIFCAINGSGIPTLIITLIGIISSISLNIIFFFVFRKEIAKDKSFMIWSRIHYIIAKFIYILGIVFSFHFYRLLYSRFLGFQVFACRLEDYEIYWKYMNIFTILSIILYNIIIMGADVCGFITIPLISQANVLVFETFIISLIIIIFALYEFKHSKMNIDDLIGTVIEEKYDLLEEKSASESQIKLSRKSKVMKSESATRILQLSGNNMVDEVNEEELQAHSFPSSPKSIEETNKLFSRFQINEKYPIIDFYLDNIYYESKNKRALKPLINKSDKYTQTIPFYKISRFKHLMRFEEEIEHLKKKSRIIPDLEEIKEQNEKENEEKLNNIVTNEESVYRPILPQSQMLISERKPEIPQIDFDIKLNPDEKDEELENTIKNHHLMTRTKDIWIKKTPRRKTKPPKSKRSNPSEGKDNKNFTGKKNSGVRNIRVVEDSEILGSFDRDEDNCILIIQDLNGNLLDKRSRKVNRHGYLIDSEGNILNQKGEIVYRFYEIDFEDDVLNKKSSHLLGKEKQETINDDKEKKVHLSASINRYLKELDERGSLINSSKTKNEIISNNLVHQETDIKPSEDLKVVEVINDTDSRRSDPINPLMDDKPSNYDEKNKREHLKDEKYMINSLKSQNENEAENGLYVQGKNVEEVNLPNLPNSIEKNNENPEIRKKDKIQSHGDTDNNILGSDSSLKKNPSSPPL